MSETTPVKVSELPELTTPDDSDLLMIVDTSATASKKITINNIKEAIVGDIATALDAINGEEI